MSRTLKLVNPRPHRKRNSVLYVIANTRKSAMAKRHRSSKKASHHRNPFKKSHRTHYRRHRHVRNPMFGGVSGKQILELGLGAVGGMIGSGYISQMVLGGSNVGLMGYLSDAVATIALSWLANKFSSSEIAKGVLAGGFGALGKRIWQDNVSGTSTSMSGLGNRDFASLGYYTPRNFPLPTSTSQYALAQASAAGGTIPGGPAQVVATAPVTPPNPGGRWRAGRWGHSPGL
jgi:hypothetical protein